MAKYQFIFTNHLRERFKERFCNSQEKKLERRELDSKIAQELKTVKENKAIFNNSRFIVYLMETYKITNYKFFCNDRIIFVVVPKKDGDVIITCYDKKSSFIPHLAEKSKKYKKKNKEEF